MIWHHVNDVQWACVMMSIHCPQCNTEKIVKNGFVKGRQRFKCKECKYQFTNLSKERGKPLWMKLEAVLMYMSGLSMNATAKLLDVSAQSVLNWVRDFGEANYEKPAPASAIVVELDELWHFIQKKKESFGSGKHMTVLMADSSTGNWEVVIVKPWVVSWSGYRNGRWLCTAQTTGNPINNYWMNILTLIMSSARVKQWQSRETIQIIAIGLHDFIAEEKSYPNQSTWWS